MTGKEPRNRPGGIPVRRLALADRPVRLDLTVNPYGPSLRVNHALAASDVLHLPQPKAEGRLRTLLAEINGVSPRQVFLGNGVDDIIRLLMLRHREIGPVAVFPPTNDGVLEQARDLHVPVVVIERTHRFTVEIEPDLHTRLIPKGALSWVQSPDDPTGTVIASADLVRLSRLSSLVVVDERHGGYSARSMLPYVQEMANVAILGSFEWWAGLAGLPFAYLIAPPRIVADLSDIARDRLLTPASVIAAEETIADLPWVKATTDRVRDEKARLYRTIRKLNMVRPMPSWANFLLMRVERGHVTDIRQGLASRQILVHHPTDHRLTGYLRVSASSPEHTYLLKDALIDIAREMDS